MSSIPPNMNIAGAFAQTQVSAESTARTKDAERNKRARDARELAKLADQQQHEVENTEEAENLRVHREGEGDTQHPQDTFEPEPDHEVNPLYHPPDDEKNSSDKTPLADDDDRETPHIDLSA